MTIQEALDYLNQYRNAGNHIHREAMDMAIEVLEKKIAKKPIEKWTGDECPGFDKDDCFELSREFKNKYIDWE
jgi:hypothetical protein